MALCTRARYIYRIETEDGSGPYACGAVNGFGFDRIKHPTPIDDWEVGFITLRWYERRLWYFGFRSLAQLKAWFYDKNHRKHMAERRLKVCKYRVPARQAHVSDKQAIFLKSAATKVAEIDLATI